MWNENYDHKAKSGGLTNGRLKCIIVAATRIRTSRNWRGWKTIRKREVGRSANSKAF